MTVTDFIQYLEAERDYCLIQGKGLANDDRRDEADMLKIRANIFSVFAVVSQTAVKRFPQNPISFIKDRIETIPAAWEASLAVSQKENDYDKVAAEQIKLQAMNEIRQKFNDILGKCQ